MEVNGHLHATASLSPTKEVSLFIEEEVGCAQIQSGCFGKQESPLPLPETEPQVTSP
jgi:hypothetical protein